MSAALALAPAVIHALPGRLRIHVPDTLASQPQEAESRIAGLPGVTSARVSGVTGNALILYDASVTSEDDILRALASWDGRVLSDEGPTSEHPHHHHHHHYRRHPERHHHRHHRATPHV